MLAKRDLENARLREQREQQSAELNERKQKDAVKYASIQEYKSLLESNSVTFNFLYLYFAEFILFLGTHTNITI
jgi:E3 ubiquitin-protein ligase BRE1